MTAKRYRAEHWIRRNQDELAHYARAFAERMIPAFANLDEEAERIRNEAFARISTDARLLDDNGLPRLPNPPTGEYPAVRLEKHMHDLGADLTAFKSWSSIDQLRLVANVVKHGEGRSAEELKRRNPERFGRQQPPELRGVPTSLPAMPLIGQALRLTEEDFERYRATLLQFWDELAEALVPVCCPAAPSDAN